MTKKSNAHPGQAHSSARKRRNRDEKKFRGLQAQLTAKNPAQARQNAVRAEIIVNGLNHWREAFPATVNIHPAYTKFFGTKAVDTQVCYQFDADINHVSLERVVISELLSMGYLFEELEVQFDSRERASWGVCRWIKEHPSYFTPDKEMQRFFPDATPEHWSLIASMFATEHAGEQKASVLSTQMIGASLTGQDPRILLHKTLVFRRAVLVLPAEAQTMAA